ncbi:unnamed protein product [Enterobius vermicularis]|uniref:Uncharacterized protein n=1 Tax=Enterobius vermicularis TaxID=51028 RepID=A0A0N4VE19_ENTVE|nr:unnamed protein product [Enterobius vermicularis]
MLLQLFIRLLLDFYEFPLDATITWSRQNFLAFCRMTMRKILCFKQNCGIHRRRVPWSTDVHLCLYRKQQFLSSLKCFNLTATGAHHTCNRYCTKVSNRYRLKPEEQTYLANLKLSKYKNATYIEMSMKCYFQICQYECRKKLMDGRCDDEEKVVAMDALYDYYAHDQLDQYQALAAQRHQNMLPLMCRTLLPHRYEVNNAANDIVKYEVDKLRRDAPYRSKNT